MQQVVSAPHTFFAEARIGVDEQATTDLEIGNPSGFSMSQSRLRDLDEQIQHSPWGRGRMRRTGDFKCRRAGAETSDAVRPMLWVPSGARAAEGCACAPGKTDGVVQESGGGDARLRGFFFCPVGLVTWAVMGHKLGYLCREQLFCGADLRARIKTHPACNLSSKNKNKNSDQTSSRGRGLILH